MRARSYQVLVHYISHRLNRPSLKILDLGAGNGWLSNRLSQQGHRVAAVDVLDDPLDGLGAHTNYDTAFAPVQAEFDRLPFEPQQFDLAIFNASLHYSVSYRGSLRAAMKVIKVGGEILILDTPIYHDRASGESMVRERSSQFHERYGVRSDSLPSANYLTFDELDRLGKELDINWQLQTIRFGLKWRLKPCFSKLLGRREPANFALIIGQPVSRQTELEPVESTPY